MICPYCSHEDSKVTDKRDVGKFTRRRRECLGCNRRFSTHERVELSDLKVIKKDGKIEVFDREKIKRGVLRACEKRPVDDEKVEAMIDRIENKLRLKKEGVKTSHIGEMVSKELKKIDKVAYIRYASVYREFAEISDFKNEIKELLRK
jgi:transcriptional repressor NrdR